MNTQEMYETCALHLLKQNEKSVPADSAFGNTCLYRGPNGLMCGVGILIKDAFYGEALEGQGVVDDMVINAVELSIGRELTGIEQELLNDIQYCHDDYFPESWKSELVWIGEKYDLDTTKVREYDNSN